MMWFVFQLAENHEPEWVQGPPKEASQRGALEPGGHPGKQVVDLVHRVEVGPGEDGDRSSMPAAWGGRYSKRRLR